jgi:hypothetical protein
MIVSYGILRMMMIIKIFARLGGNDKELSGNCQIIVIVGICHYYNVTMFQLLIRYPADFHILCIIVHNCTISEREVVNFVIIYAWFILW